MGLPTNTTAYHLTQMRERALQQTDSPYRDYDDVDDYALETQANQAKPETPEEAEKALEAELLTYYTSKHRNQEIDELEEALLLGDSNQSPDSNNTTTAHLLDLLQSRDLDDEPYQNPYDAFDERGLADGDLPALGFCAFPHNTDLSKTLQSLFPQFDWKNGLDAKITFTNSEAKYLFIMGVNECALSFLNKNPQELANITLLLKDLKKVQEAKNVIKPIVVPASTQKPISTLMTALCFAGLTALTTIGAMAAIQSKNEKSSSHILEARDFLNDGDDAV